MRVKWDVHIKVHIVCFRLRAILKLFLGRRRYYVLFLYFISWPHSPNVRLQTSWRENFANCNLLFVWMGWFLILVTPHGLSQGTVGLSEWCRPVLWKVSGKCGDSGLAQAGRAPGDGRASLGWRVEWWRPGERPMEYIQSGMYTRVGKIRSKALSHQEEFRTRWVGQSGQHWIPGQEVVSLHYHSFIGSFIHSWQVLIEPLLCISHCSLWWEIATDAKETNFLSSSSCSLRWEVERERWLTPREMQMSVVFNAVCLFSPDWMPGPVSFNLP